jgi:hypothetical protein
VRVSSLAFATALAAAAGCASAKNGGTDQPDGSIGPPMPDGCGANCDSDYDGVPDSIDQCPNSPPLSMVNTKGCADTQVDPKLQPNFPPYALSWTHSGNLGRPGGLVWTYTGIQRGDLFHIYWVVCDDPAMPCGLSLDGPIDAAGEHWTYSPTDSDLPNGKLIFTNATGILLDDTTTRPLDGRLTVTVTDATNVPMPVATVMTLGIAAARMGQAGVEVKGTAYQVTGLIEVKDTTGTYTPYLDYYDAAPTPMAGGAATVSYGGSFYDE